MATIPTKAQLMERIATLSERADEARRDLAAAQIILKQLAAMRMVDGGPSALWSKCPVCHRTVPPSVSTADPRWPHREDCGVILARRWLEQYESRRAT